MTNTHKIRFTIFTDPMMGLSYESEPVMRKLETHFAGHIQFFNKMALLVKDVYDFVNPADLSQGNAYAIKQYNKRLAQIYLQEERISQMPINMEGFNLFSPKHTSSLPLNLAYKTALQLNAQQADLFLYNLRYATIVECRPTTHLEEIMRVVKKSGLSSEGFLRQYHLPQTRQALEEDLQLCTQLGIYSLPAYLISYQGNSILLQGVQDCEHLVWAINRVSRAQITPTTPQANLGNLRTLLQQHPLISPIEIREAFSLPDMASVRTFIAPLLQSQEVEIISVPKGYFLKTISTTKHTGN